MTTPPAVLVGGSANVVAVARSLGRAGVHVTALGREDDPARWSRHVERFVDLGADEDAPGRWIAWLLEDGPPGAVVLACADSALEAIAARHDDLVGRGLRPQELDRESVSTVLDKSATVELAERAGVPAPVAVRVRSQDELAAAAERVGYPCCLKPDHSHLFAPHFDRKLFVVRDEAELRAAYGPCEELGLQMAVVELVPGPDSDIYGYYAYLDESGEPLYGLTGRKLRQHPVHFGVGCYRVIEPVPGVAEFGLRFLRAARVRGMAHVEVKRDARDGRLRLIECNLRFPQGVVTLHAAGFDLALLVYRRAAGGEMPRMGHRDGVRTWNPIADTRAFLDYRREGELSTAAWLRSLMHRQHFPVASLSDPMPTIGYHWVRARRRAVAPIRRRSAGPPG